MGREIEQDVAMSARSSKHVPGMSDAAVEAKTGRRWTAWFMLLDRAGAKRLEHRDIAKILRSEHGMPGWWAQCVTVEYELSRGLREKYRNAKGYTVSVSKTVEAPLAELYLSVSDAARRKRWFPSGAFEPSSKTENKYFRGAWKKHMRVEMGVYTKGANKSQIAIQVNNIAAKDDVERVRESWKAAVAKLERMLA